MPEPHLAIADADKIHEYVFSPHELKLIRGGSALQADLNRNRLKQLVVELGGDCISANGGTVLAAFEDVGPANEFCQQAERMFLTATHVATLTTEAMAYRDTTFAEDRKKLLTLLERKKQCGGIPRFRAAGAFMAPCDACGLHSSVTFDANEAKRLCQACVARQEHSRRHPYAPKDFNALGLLSRPENYLALVYIDLDGLGEFLSNHITCKEVCRGLSSRIDRQVLESTREACRSLKANNETDPFEILIAGGDDALVALPAHLAFPFLEAFTRLYLTDPLTTFSVGLVIAQSRFPIAEFVRIGEELLRSAKALRGSNAIHYAVLTESMADKIVSGDADIAGRRTANPYGIESFFKLVAGIRELKKKNAPASKIHSLYRIAHEGPLQAELDYLYLLSRLEEQHAHVLRQPDMIGQRLFQESITRAADIVELWDFIHAD